MSKYLVLFIGLLWATLMLTSWSGTAESSAPARSAIATVQGY